MKALFHHLFSDILLYGCCAFCYSKRSCSKYVHCTCQLFPGWGLRRVCPLVMQFFAALFPGSGFVRLPRDVPVDWRSETERGRRRSRAPGHGTIERAAGRDTPRQRAGANAATCPRKFAFRLLCIRAVPKWSAIDIQCTSINGTAVLHRNIKLVRRRRRFQRPWKVLEECGSPQPLTWDPYALPFRNIDKGIGQTFIFSICSFHRTRSPDADTHLPHIERTYNVSKGSCFCWTSSFN